MWLMVCCVCCLDSWCLARFLSGGAYLFVVVLCGVCCVGLSEIEKRLIELDKALHSVLEMIRKLKGREEGVVEVVAGAWGYDVDSREFVRGLRRSKRV